MVESVINYGDNYVDIIAISQGLRREVTRKIYRLSTEDFDRDMYATDNVPDDCTIAPD